MQNFSGWTFPWNLYGKGTQTSKMGPIKIITKFTMAPLHIRISIRTDTEVGLKTFRYHKNDQEVGDEEELAGLSVLSSQNCRPDANQRIKSHSVKKSKEC